MGEGSRGADHQLVLATEELEGAGEIDIQRVALGFAGVLLRNDLGAVVRCRPVAHDRAEGRVVAVDLVIELHLADPAVGEIVLELAKTVRVYCSQLLHLAPLLKERETSLRLPWLSKSGKLPDQPDPLGSLS